MKKSLGAKTILYPTPVLIVGTYDAAGKPNAMTAAWGGICCSSPPCVAVSLRKATYTYGNIAQQGGFTINIPSEKHVLEADYFGLMSGKKTDKFAESGLTPVRSDLVNAPYIAEFPFVLECRLLRRRSNSGCTRNLSGRSSMSRPRKGFSTKGGTGHRKNKALSLCPRFQRLLWHGQVAWQGLFDRAGREKEGQVAGGDRVQGIEQSNLDLLSVTGALKETRSCR